MDKKNNTGLIIGIVIIVLVIIVIIVALAKKPAMAPVTNTGDTPAMTTAGETTGAAMTGTTAGATAGATVGGTAVTPSYQQALITYKDRRIQFNDMCQATPNKVTYKDNTGLMLDNRSNKDLVIKVGSSYTVPAYGFKIITLPDTYKSSSTFLIDCGKQQNVATLLIQE
jgi:hypothetical protein